MPKRRPARRKHDAAAASNGRRINSLRREIERGKQVIAARNASLLAARTELAESVDRYANLFDNLPAAYFTLDAHGVVTEANRSASRFLAHERQRLVGRLFLNFVEQADRPSFLDHMRRCRRDGNARTELRLLGRVGGDPVLLESHSATGSVGTGYRTSLTDSSPRRRSQIERVRTEGEKRLAESREQAAKAASEAKDLFIAELSHELRTPLTPILAAVSSLAGREDLPESLRPTIDMIRRNVEVEARLIDDLLDLSRIERRHIRLELGLCDAHEIIQEATAHLVGEAEAHRIRFVLELYAPERHLRADPLRVRQIVLNLISNAIRNSPRGGNVSISTCNMAADLRITIRDEGIGIAADRLQRIFEPFNHGESPAQGSKGLGLGLAIVKGLVEAHRGRVVALSDGVGQGATFVVDLPTATAPSLAFAGPPAKDTAAESPRRGGGRRILLVEDHADTSAALKVFLELRGFHVDTAANGAEAVARAESDPDVVICDIGLPDTSGFDVMRKISAERPVKAIALTGYGSEHDIERAKQAGFAMHLTKPVTVEHLLEAIEQLSRSSDAETV